MIPDNVHESKMIYRPRLSPYGRKLLIRFGMICSLYLAIVLAINLPSLLVLGSLMPLLGMILLYYFTSEKRRYVTPIIMVLMFMIGYVLDFANLVVVIDELPAIGWGSIGFFDFTNREFIIVLSVVCVSLFGIAVGAFLAEAYIPKVHESKNNTLKSETSVLNPAKLTLWVWMWFIFSLLMIFFLSHIGIGRTGLMHETALPLRITGFLSHLRNIFIPYVGFFLLSQAIEWNRRRLTGYFVCLMLIVGILSSLSAISRGHLMSLLFIPLLYVIFKSKKKSWTLKIAWQFLIAILILSPLLIAAIQNLRNIAYEIGSLSLYQVFANLYIPDLNLRESLWQTFTSATGRIGGIRQLMAVSDSQISDMYAVWVLFSTGGGYIGYIHQQILGFIPFTSDYMAFGYSYGLMGTLFLSGSYMVTFLGSILVCLFIVLVEDYFLRYSTEAVAFFASFMVTLQIWSLVPFTVIAKILVMLVFCHFMVKFIRKSILNPALQDVKRNDPRTA